MVVVVLVAVIVIVIAIVIVIVPTPVGVHVAMTVRSCVSLRLRNERTGAIAFGFKTVDIPEQCGEHARIVA